jgi:hypothetical protein
MTVIIGVDPHKASHTAVAISDGPRRWSPGSVTTWSSSCSTTFAVSTANSRCHTSGSAPAPPVAAKLISRRLPSVGEDAGGPCSLSPSDSRIVTAYPASRSLKSQHLHARLLRVSFRSECFRRKEENRPQGEVLRSLGMTNPMAASG